MLRHLKMKERVSQLLTLDSSLVMMSNTDYHQAQLEQIRKIVDTRLSSKDRQILLMKYERKMKYHEIAAELDISEAAVYKHLSNALKTLKDNFKDE
jgi:RNA polymerase sigma factor (sigma-70 family)